MKTQLKIRKNWLLMAIIMVLLVQGCNLPGSATSVATTVPPTESSTNVPPPISTPTISHVLVPVIGPDAAPYPDVVSVDTAPEKRAPYGDSFEINRLERPFTQDMIYIPDMDISSFGISEDADWFYVSIGVVGKNPNNAPGIQFALELDTNRDSFGDFLIVSQPPYAEQWTAENIKIYTDTNRDSAGASPSKSDAPFSGNGYDQLILSPTEGIGSDFDTAWVRINAGQYATVQFAFKKTFAGSSFLYSVMADAGLKDVNRLDYVDYFTEIEAGSPVRDNPNYPLKALFGVDNTCYQAMGFSPSGYEPKICPEIVQPQNAKEPSVPGATAPACQLSLSICQNQGYGDFNPLTCQCIPIG